LFVPQALVPVSRLVYRPSRAACAAGTVPSVRQRVTLARGARAQAVKALRL